MAVFNKKRKAFIAKQGISKYLFYGLGEVILVVIGILVAVAINNYNEKKASEVRLESYLKVYQKDLETDTLVVGQVLKLVENREDFFKLFLSDTITAKTYRDNPQGYGLILCLI